MSTLNVANISDDQSTLTGSGQNPTDKLHSNTAVDTKFVTSGCAKAYGTCRADASMYTNSGATLNISSTASAGSSNYVYNFANYFNNPYAAVSDVAGTNDRSCQVKSRNTAYVQTLTRIGKDGVLTENANSVVILGDLA